jgi:hypothetical protein
MNAAITLYHPGACSMCGGDVVCEDCINAELRDLDPVENDRPQERKINIASGEDMPEWCEALC